MMARMFWTFSTTNLGACHADEIIYLFQVTPVIDLIPTSKDKQVSRDMVRMWTNFAAYGDPNGRGEKIWKAVKTEEKCEKDYFIINEEPRMKTLEELSRFNHWR